MYISYDSDADAMYIMLRPDAEHTIDHSIVLDEARRVEVDRNGQAIAIEILNVSAGFDLSGLPDLEQIRALVGTLREIPQPA